MSDDLRVNLVTERGQFRMALNLAVPITGVTFLFGPSGSGKTTLMRSIAGLERHPDCEIRFRGDVWQDHRRFVPAHQRAVGMVFQEPSLLPHLDVRRNLEYGLKRVRRRARTIALATVVDCLALAPLLKKYDHQLSGGQRQRVALGRALLTSPELLLLDEPLASLDLAGKADILHYLETVQRQLSIPMIYVSHALEEVLRLADRLVYLHNGQVLATGDVNELLTSPALGLSQLDDASTMIAGRVQYHDPQFHLTYIALAKDTIAISIVDLPIDAPVKIRILAKDVSLALAKATNSSISNIIEARILQQWQASDPSQVIVQLDIAGVKLLSRITRKSQSLMRLEAGMTVFAQIKSVALLR